MPFRYVREHLKFVSMVTFKYCEKVGNLIELSGEVARDDTTHERFYLNFGQRIENVCMFIRHLCGIS